jgi:phosphatidate cytidylyltransferase
MALNIKTLGIRALSALVFVVILVGCLLWNYYSFSVFFFVVAMMGLNEFYTLSEKFDAKPYKIMGFVSGAITYLLFTPLFASSVIYVITLIPFIIFLVALYNRRNNPIQNALFTISGILYAVIPFGLLHGLVLKPGEGTMEFNPYLLFGIILLIWSNDTFAYLGGSLFGKHKMIERISPGKTWEGTIFGIVLTFVLACVIGKYVQGNMALWSILGVTVPLLATVGDLVESMIKRQAGIKDTGSIMPGHGGVLDRFDSLIFVSPFVFVILKLIVLPSVFG